MSDTLAVPGIDEFIASVRKLAPRVPGPDQAPERFAVDGITPAVVVAAADAGAVRAVLREAQHAGLSVIAIGGGQHLGTGNRPVAYDVALSLGAMRAVLAHEPADMTVTVEAGVRLADLNLMLSQHGQMLPLDPPCDPEATVGGVLAANAFGPLRHAFGTARDWLIGGRLAHADGGASKSGGRVVKNVTGYDMHKLYIGSLGTLGVITEATFKLAPTPRAGRTLVAPFAAARDACDAVLAAHGAGLALYAADVLSPHAAGVVCGDARWTAVVRVAGGEAAVTRTLRDLPRHAGGATFEEHADDLWARWAQAFRPSHISLRTTVLPATVGAALDALDRSGQVGSPMLLAATVTAGVIRAQVAAGPGDTAAIAPTREIVSVHGGTVVLDSAPPGIKDALDVFGPPRADLAIMRRLKQQFDPRGTLSPGRFAGRL
ncbi:MAG TPA: FAD-binding oxidoreductase [Dehalococcoidia bacterium]|nr:FAD-binding oxidoreductase [Dehalococcoidia bacterium]